MDTVWQLCFFDGWLCQLLTFDGIIVWIIRLCQWSVISGLNKADALAGGTV